MNDKDLLVIKSIAYMNNPDLGIVIPISYIDSNNQLLSIGEEDFPNGGIFISKNYALIDQDYRNDELFILTDYFITDDESWKDNSKYQKHYAFGNKTRKLEPNILIPIITMNLPDKSTGIVSDGIDLPTGIFFIENGEFIFGPFKAVKQEQQWLLTPINSPSPLNLSTDSIIQVSKEILQASNLLFSVKVGKHDRLFIKSLRLLANIEFNRVDYISDVKLINYFTKHGFGNTQYLLAKKEAQKLAQCIDDYLKKNKSNENYERINRLKSLLTKYLNDSGYEKKIIEEFLSDTQEGRKYLDYFIEKNKVSILKDKTKDIDLEIKKRKVLLENEIKELEKLNANKRNELTSIKNRVNEAKEQAEHEIKRIKEESSTAIQKELLTKQRKLTEKNENLEGQIKTKENLLSEFYTEEKNINNYKELLEEINYLTRKKQDVEKEKKVIEEAIEHRKTTLNSTNLNDKLVEVDILTSILSGKKKQQTILEQYPKQNVLKNEFSLTNENKEDYINYLIAKFDNEHGIHYDFDQMANLLVSLTQSFLTILAGPPGTGKTSSIHKLAYSLGLTNSVESCSSSYFLSVPVGRGWVSSRDVLGFYNSLKEVYQPAKTGLYQFLYQKNEDNVFKIVLLDEANLSSIEHYWSDFLGMCDIDGDKRSIDLGISNEKNRFLEIPKQLRFIATINNDSTTEKLSPRLIDRVPIISLGYKNSDNYVNNVNEIMSDFIGAVDFDEINEIFNIKSSEAQLSSAEDAILKQVLDNLSDFTSKRLSIHVSPRKLNAIKKYCSVMNNIEGLRIQPLDYAIAQHILPLIEGFGKEFKESLNRLDNKFIELDLQISHKLIRDIIDSGDLYGESYSFF